MYKGCRFKAAHIKGLLAAAAAVTATTVIAATAEAA